MASSQQHVSSSTGANSITQLSFDDPPPTTSTHLKFISQTNNNLHGNLLFPVAENDENAMTYTRKTTSHNLLKYLKSKRILRNIEINKTFKSKQYQSTCPQRFPLAEGDMTMENFPFKNPMQDNLYDHHRKKEIKLKKLTFPLKLAREKRTFPYNNKRPKTRTEKDLNVKLKHCTYTKRTLRKLPLDTNLKRFPSPKVFNIKANKEFSLQNNLHSLYKTNENEFKFPLKLSKSKGIFPIENRSESETNLLLPNCNQQYHIKEISQIILNEKSYEEHKNQNINKIFPCQFRALSCISKFPINKQFTQYEHSCNENNLGNLCNINMSKNSKTPNFLPSLLMTHTDLEMKNIDNEHVPQVQDAQLEENPQSLTTAESKHPSPQTAKANRIYDDVDILADINSINNTRPNEVGYYAKKIELLQDVIIALFEKIQNSLTTNHNTERESRNAAKYDHGDANNRFALTPTMSVTSVQNATESNNHIKEHLCKKYDLGDLCDHQVGQIVECSEVRDTFAEAVDYGITKEKAKSTLSILEKSEEPTFPHSVTPNLLNELEQTSFEDCKNVSELLTQNNVLTVNEEINVDVKYTSNLEFDSNNKTDIQNKSNEIAYETVTNKREIAKASEMTVSRLKKKEPENPKDNKNSSNTNETIANKKNILYNDPQFNEMKYEMNRVKGALPSSASERSRGKHDSAKTATSSTRLPTDTALSNNKLAHTLTSARNHNETLYAPRSSLKNETSSLGSTAPKRSTLTSHPRQDGITNLSAANSTSINDSTSARTSNDCSGDPLSSHRRTSFGSSRNNQLTPLLSVDLPRCSPLDPSDKTSLVNRAVSIDSSVLPERTRLRRQRRLRTQDSRDEPEDPMERLNLLKARISASLSEVKGVLKQYSTETENENENQTTKAVTSVSESKQAENKEGPITFRFVKKIRRRSVFTEDDEEEKNDNSTNTEPPKDETDKNMAKQLEIKDEINNCKLETESILPSQGSGIKEIPNKQPVEKQVESKNENDIEINRNLCTLKEEVAECLQDLPPAESRPKISIVNQKTPKDDIQTLNYETKGAIPKPTVKHETDKLKNESSQDISRKTKKKIIIKSKNPSRRASLAALEGSKIEPPVKLAVPAQIQRRPSDSAAMVKKTSITGKLNTSGVVEEVTPEPKIVKVKKSSIEINNNSQLAPAQTNLKQEETVANTISDHLVKPIDEDQNKSIHIDKSKDILMPKRPEAEKQQQFNNEFTSQTNILQPTQLVIDEAASLNEKTIKNSMLPPRQQQQQQRLLQQQQIQHRKQDQQATISSAATNFISNDLQAKDAMLENVTTELSSSAASEANGQINRENAAQQEDFLDLLQQETTIIKPANKNQQNELKLVKQDESDQSKVKDIVNDNLNGNLGSVKITTKERHQLQQQQQKTPIHQQVIATVDVAHVKSHEGNNKNDDIKSKVSSKEPSKDKIITSSHLEIEHQQRGEDQSITNAVDTKTVSSPHISISSTSDITHKTTTASLLPAESVVEKKAEVPAAKHNAMPEFQLAPAPVQTADIISHPELHQKNAIIKRIVRQTSIDKATKKAELQNTKSPQESKQITHQPSPDKTEALQKAVEKVPSDTISNQTKPTPHIDQHATEISAELDQEEGTEECSESTEISESSTSIGSEELAATPAPKKERKVKKKVIIKRQKRRLSVGDSFFHSGNSEDQQNADIETLEKPIAYVTDDETENINEKAEELADDEQEHQEEKKPLKSCILQKEYNIGDEVLYAERFKKTQIKWRRGRVKERITSISYLLDIDGKDVSSHINYLKRFTGRKVSFGGKEYLEIDYEQLAEEEEKAERLQRRSYSIWNMV